MDVPFSNRMRFHAIFFLSLVSLVGACNLGSVSDQSTSPHAAATGGTSLPGGASTGGTTGTVPPPASLYEPLPPSVYVAKVKNLLIGSAPTAAEANAVITDANALGALIDQWMATPQYDEKMLLFFGDAFQQSQVGFYDFQNQSGIGVEDAYTYFDLRQSFARTALELVKEGQPFNTTMTTNRFMVTTPLLIFYAYDDTQVTDDAGNITDRVMAQNPNWYFRLEQSAGPVALSQTLDPNSPNYLTFYDPLLASNNGCSLPDPLVFNSAIQYPTSQLYRYLLGNRVEFRNANFLCYEQPPQDHSRVLDPNEFFQWRMVTIRRPQLGESTTPFWDVQTLRTASEIVLNIPRFGFFSTPAFLAGWQTNASNQSRVTMNQTLIVGLNHAFDGTDSTTAPSLAALDAGHAPQGSPCFTCHQTLDPMRQFFRNAYTLYAHEQTDANMLRLPGMFAYGGGEQSCERYCRFGHRYGHTSALCAGLDTETLHLCDVGILRRDRFRIYSHRQAICCEQLLMDRIGTRYVFVTPCDLRDIDANRRQERRTGCDCAARPLMCCPVQPSQDG